MTGNGLQLLLALWVEGALSLALLWLMGAQRVPLVMNGKIAVSESLEAAILPHVTDPDQDLVLPGVEDPALAARIAGPERGGYLESGDRLLVFAKLVSPPWTYVAELEKARYIEH